MNAIFTRRSVRQFEEKLVEQEKIEKILRAAMQAPSAANQQPWDFIVVEGKENLAKLAAYNPYAGCLRQAACGIIVLGNKDRMVLPEHWEQDLGAVTQNILLEATELGIGSVWFGTAPDKTRMRFVNDLYNLADNFLPYSVIGLGYPQNPNELHFVDRYDETRIHYVK